MRASSSIDTAAAEALPGVACVLTGKDILAQCDPFMQLGPEPCDKIRDLPLAVDKVIFQGEPVAAIAATSVAIAMDAGQLIDVDYEMLDAVVDAEEALTDKVILHEAAGTNRTWHGVYEYGDVDQAFPRCGPCGAHSAHAFSSLRQHAAGRQCLRGRVDAPGHR